MKHNSRMVNRVLSIGFIALFAFMFAMLTRNPADRVRVDNGSAYVERSTWWGLSKRNVPLRNISGQWSIQTPAGWMPYDVEPDFGRDAPNSLDR